MGQRRVRFCVRAAAVGLIGVHFTFKSRRRYMPFDSALSMCRVWQARQRISLVRFLSYFAGGFKAQVRFL